MWWSLALVQQNRQHKTAAFPEFFIKTTRKNMLVLSLILNLLVVSADSIGFNRLRNNVNNYKHGARSPRSSMGVLYRFKSHDSKHKDRLMRRYFRQIRRWILLFQFLCTYYYFLSSANCIKWLQFKYIKLFKIKFCWFLLTLLHRKHNYFSMHKNIYNWTIHV